MIKVLRREGNNRVLKMRFDFKSFLGLKKKKLRRKYLYCQRFIS